MEKAALGSSGLEVSIFGLGTMTFGAESDEAASMEILHRYFDDGGRFIDTADVYSRGVAEQFIGRWLHRRGIRDQMTIATKARFARGPGVEDRGAGRAHLTAAIEASLRRLDVEFIDLYQVHAWDAETPLEETLETLDGLVDAGKVRAIGVSNYTGWQIERAVLIGRHEGWAPVVSVQPQYNLLSREAELGVIPVCLENDLAILPWSPLGGGWLTGKYSAERRPTGATRLGEDPTRGVEAYDLRNNEQTWRVIEVVESIAATRGVSMSQVALNWLLARPGVTSVLLGCRAVEQLTDNLGALAWSLEPEEMHRLDRVSAPGIPMYPHGFLERMAGFDVWKTLATRADPPPTGK